MSKLCDNCPYWATTGCTVTSVDGVWKCTKEMDGKTLVLRTSTTGTEASE